MQRIADTAGQSGSAADGIIRAVDCPLRSHGVFRKERS
jgi:hypothetical protein